MIYYIMFAIAVFLSSLSDKSKRSVSSDETGSLARFFSQSFPLAAVAFLIFISATRTMNVGVDSATYAFYFEIGESNFRGPAFEFIYEILGLFSRDYTLVFFVTSSLFIGTIYYVVFKLSNSYALSTFVFTFGTFYVSSFNNLRQWIAASFLFLALYFCLKEKPLKYIIAIVVAASFHTSAVVFAPIYLLRNIRVKPSKVLLAILICIPIALSVITPIGMWIVTNIEEFARYLSLEKSFIDKQDFAVTDALLMAFPLLLWGVCRSSNNELKDSKMESVLVITSSIGLVLSISSVSFFLASRLLHYFYLPHLILIPLVLRGISNISLKQFAYVYTALFYIFIFAIRINFVGMFGVDPYESIFFS